MVSVVIWVKGKHHPDSLIFLFMPRDIRLAPHATSLSVRRAQVARVLETVELGMDLGEGLGHSRLLADNCQLRPVKVELAHFLLPSTRPRRLLTTSHSVLSDLHLSHGLDGSGSRRHLDFRRRHLITPVSAGGAGDWTYWRQAADARWREDCDALADACASGILL